MGRIARVTAILIVSVVLTTGAVLASTGQLRVFEPDAGSLSQRLTAVEDFLESNSREVASIIQPATCPTAEEAAYLADLEADIEALADAFDGMSSTTDLDAIVAVAVAVFERVPPLSIRGQLLHVESRRFSVSTLALVSAMKTEIDDGADSADALDRIKPDITRWAVELVVVTYLVGQFCDDSQPSAADTPAPTTRTPTATRTPTPAPTVATQHPLAAEFGCQWIMDTYRSVAMAGRDLAILNLSTAMTAKRLEQGSFIFVGTGDAAAALRACESLGPT